jgi:hypothetical protein
MNKESNFGLILTIFSVVLGPGLAFNTSKVINAV